MHVKRIMMSIAVLAVAGTSAADAAAPKLKGGQYASQAKVTLAAARRTALHVRPGTITDQELEREKGGSGLRYSFDVTSRGRPYEVGVDARTGAVLENAAEGKNPD